MRRSACAQPRAKSCGASSASSPTGRPTTLETLPSIRSTRVEPERLDRVAARPPPPLAERDVALLLGLVQLPEDDRRPLQPGCAPRRRRAPPARSAPRAPAPTCGPGMRAPRRVGRACPAPCRRATTSVSQAITSVPSPRRRRPAPCSRAFSSTSTSGSPPLSSSTPGTTTPRTRSPELLRGSRCVSAASPDASD